MHNEISKMTLLAAVTLMLISCGEQKKEEVVQPQQPEEVQPTKPASEEPLTPQQQDQLKIDEDNVMEPFPG